MRSAMTVVSRSSEVKNGSIEFKNGDGEDSLTIWDRVKTFVGVL
jgi:hypothetical protein